MSTTLTFGIGLHTVAGALANPHGGLAAAARASTRHGMVVFGFVGAADNALADNERVVVPHGSVREPFSVRANGVADEGYADKYVECLLTDAATVATFDVPEKARAFIAANRANSYAAGYLGEESVVAPRAVSDYDRESLVVAYPHVMDAAKMDLSKGTLAVFISSVCFYTTNHHTGGDTLPVGHAKALRHVLGSDLSDGDLVKIVRYAGHAADKRLTLRSILHPDDVRNLVMPPVYNPVYEASTDAWATMRIRRGMLPASLAPVGHLRAALGEVAKFGLLGFAPAPYAVTTLSLAYGEIMGQVGFYHPAAKYLFGCDPIELSGIEDIRSHLATFGSFCLGAGVKNSITAAPHIAALITEHRSATWYGIGKVVSQGNVACDAEAVRAVEIAGIGDTGDIPAPSVDAHGYMLAVTRISGTLHSIAM